MITTISFNRFVKIESRLKRVQLPFVVTAAVVVLVVVLVAIPLCLFYDKTKS